MDIFKLVGSIFVDTDEANSSLSKTDQNASSVGETLGKVAKGAAGVATAVVGTAAAVGGSVLSMANDSAAAMDTIDKGSQKMGITAEAYQEWDHVMSQSGMDISTMQTGMKTLQNQMDGVAQGTSSSIEAFERLGVSVYDSNGEMKDQTTMLNEVMYALADMEDGAERTALAVDLFGKSGTEMLPVLNSGTEGIDALKQEAHDLGLVFSDETVSAGVVYGDAMANVQDAISALGTSLGNEFAPLLTDVCYFITDNLPKIQEMFSNFAPLIQSMFETILPPLMDLVTTLLPVIVDLVNQLMPVISEIIEAVLPVVVELVQALAPFLVELCDKVLPTIVKLISLISPILEPIMSLLQPILELTMWLLEPLLDLINLVLPPIVDLITKVSVALTEHVEKKLSKITGVLTTFRTFVKTTFEQIKKFVKDPINAIIGFINKLISGVCTGINALSNALNKINVKVPAWVTKLTGITNFGFNLQQVQVPQLAYLAKGGELNGGAAIVGEDGPELIQSAGSRTRVTPLNANNNAFVELSQKMDQLVAILQNGFGVRLDSGAMVGQLAPAIDKKLGRLATSAGRGVL